MRYAGQRQVLDSRAGEFVPHVRFVCLQRRCGRLDRDLFVDRSDLQPDILPRYGVDGHIDIGPVRRPESGRRDSQIVNPRKQVQQGEAALLIGRRFACDARALAGNGDAGFGNDRAGLVLDPLPR